MTICTNHRAELLGAIEDDISVPSPAGLMIIEMWAALTKRFSSIELDYFTLMPNHLHGIILLDADDEGIRPKLGDIIGAFKSITTHQYIQGVKQKDWPGFQTRLWQRNYYEHIIRNERALSAIRQYVADNPANWTQDQLHPNAPPNKFNTL